MPNLSRPRLVRLLKAVAVLLDHTHQPLTGAELMCQVGEIDDHTQILNDSQRRAFERLKEDLRNHGIPLESKSTTGTHFEGGEGSEQREVYQTVYWIPARQYALRNLGLTSEEELVLSLIREVLAEEQGFPLRANLGMALQKISAVSRNPYHDSSRRDVISGSPEPIQPRHDPEILDRLVVAGGEHHPVSFIYSAFHSETTRERKIEPYGFFTRKGIWYLVGRDMEADEIKVFRVSRITSKKSIQVHTHETFTVPSGFRLKNYASVPPWNFLSENQESCVTVEIDKDEFWRVSGYCQAHGQVDESVSGKVSWNLKVRDFDPLINWMLPFGAAMFPLKPGEFVERYREVVRETLAYYRS